MKNAHASTAQPAKAQLARVASGRKVNVRGKTEEGAAAATNPTPTPATHSPLAPTPTAASSPTIPANAMHEEGPFLDPPESLAEMQSHSSSPRLSAVIEGATRRSAYVDRPNSVARETSPFGDEHATKD